MPVENSFALYINGLNRSKHLVYPVKCGNFLDERLDECYITLKGDKKAVFTPLTPVEIVFKNVVYMGFKETGTYVETYKREITRHYVVANDVAYEMIPGKKIYNHDLYLIEVTKIAECIVVDTITFTNDLGRNYAANAKQAELVKEDKWSIVAELYQGEPENYVTPLQAGKSFKFASFAELFTENPGNGGFKVYFNGNLIQTIRNQTQSYTITPAIGTYKVEYVLFSADDLSVASFTFSVVENKLPLKKWTVKDVIERTLELAEPLRKGEKPRFKLNAEQAEKYDKILAPQFSFTKQTLRECLQDIGKYIHGEPRLTPVKDDEGYYYEVSYEEFEGTEKSGIYARKYLNVQVSQAINFYSSHLDCNAENLVNQLDKFSGVIAEPYAGGERTVRTENSFVRISENNMLIYTQYPIYSVDKLEWIDQSGNSIDITPYLFEKSVYDTQLSSYQSKYPYSKAYGLFYTQGGKNIGGLNFKEDAPIFPEFKSYAILNILRAATGNSGLEVDYPTLSFRISYTPFYNVRVTQSKAYYKENRYPAALIFNQQANVIESRYFGENLKGAIARLGNVEKSITYLIPKFGVIPKAGQIYDKDYYISAVAVEYLPTIAKVTIGLSKDFNRLSQYIGISSVRRFSEISQNQASERNPLYREYVVIGEEETPDEDSIIGNNLMNALADTFTQAGNYRPLTCAAAWGSTYTTYQQDVTDLVTEKATISPDGRTALLTLPNAEGQKVTVTGVTLQSEDGNLRSVPFTAESTTQTATVYAEGRGIITTITIESAIMEQNHLPPVNLPVISSAFGNSLSFSWKYEDNFSAGPISTYQVNGGVSGYFQDSYQYTDYHGKMYYYDFDLQPIGSGSDGFSVPKRSSIITESSGYLSTVGNAPYILRKDNREALQINVQIDLVTNLENMIIGSALASCCGAIRGTDSSLQAKLYVFPERLNKFIDHVQGSIDVDLNTLPSVEVAVTQSYIGQFVLSAGNFPSAGKSWAIVTAQTQLPPREVEDEKGQISMQSEVSGGDVLLAQNMDISEGKAFSPIYFTRKREVLDKTVWKEKK